MTLRTALLAALTLVPANAMAGGHGSAGDNVVELRVTEVRTPQVAGACEVDGVVARVWFGQAYRAGQSITLRVPCSAGRAGADRAPMTPAPDATGVAGIDTATLRRASRGFAHVDNFGGLMWQASRKAYGPLGRAWGYRALEGGPAGAARSKS